MPDGTAVKRRAATPAVRREAASRTRDRDPVVRLSWEAPADAEHVLVVEGHALFAHCLGIAMAAEGIQVSLVSPDSGEAVVAAARSEAPDIVVLDLDAVEELGPAADLVGALRELGTAVVVLMSLPSRIPAAECVAAGAAGAIDKRQPFDDLVRGVRETLRSGTLRLHGVRDELLAELRRHQRHQQEDLGPFARLTGAEREILAGLIDGKTTNELAAERVVSVETVRTQVKALMRKLGVNSQIAAIALARSVGWVPGRTAATAFPPPG